MICDEADPRQIRIKPDMRDGPIWADDDAVEIFLRSPKFGGPGHAQLAVNAGGSRTDLFSSRLNGDADWQASSTVTSSGRQTEIAIPFTSLMAGLDASSGWCFNNIGHFLLHGVPLAFLTQRQCIVQI